MRAKVIKQFTGRPDGSSLPRDFQPGDVVTGELAEVAVREKWAKPEAEPKAKAPAKKAAAKKGK